jgi:hypothetical protein
MIGDDEELASGGDDEADNEETNEGNEGQEGSDESDLSPEQHGEGEGPEQDAGAKRQSEGQEVLKPSRGENRFQTIANRAKAAEERAERLEREFAQFRQSNNSVSDEVKRQQEAARYALLTPEEQMREDIRKAGEQHNRELNQIKLQLQEQEDINKFNALITNSKGRFDRFKPEVEKQVQEARSRGANFPREMVLDYLVGKELREKGISAASKQAATGQKKIASQKVNPSNSRGDVNSRSRTPNEQAARRQRLENIDI